MDELCQTHSFHMCTRGLSFCLLFVCFYWSIIGLQCCVSLCYTTSDSAIHIYIYIYPLFYRFFSCIVHYRILIRVPCAVYSMSILVISFIYVVVSLLSHIQLCYPMNNSLLGSSVHGISQARILKWVAISFSRRSSPPRD